MGIRQPHACSTKTKLEVEFGSVKSIDYYRLNVPRCSCDSLNKSVPSSLSAPAVLVIDCILIAQIVGCLMMSAALHLRSDQLK